MWILGSKRMNRLVKKGVYVAESSRGFVANRVVHESLEPQNVQGEDLRLIFTHLFPYPPFLEFILSLLILNFSPKALQTQL